MSTHRLAAPSEALADMIKRATEALTIDQIRQALPEDDRHVLLGAVGAEMIHRARPMTTGNRAALYAHLDVYPVGDDPEGKRSDTHVLVSWTFHGADDLENRPNDLVLQIDRITPVRN